MTKTMIDLDDELLAEAAVALGTVTKKQTVNEALRRVAMDARVAREGALARLRERARDGAFDAGVLPGSDG